MSSPGITPIAAIGAAAGSFIGRSIQIHSIRPTPSPGVDGKGGATGRRHEDMNKQELKLLHALLTWSLSHKSTAKFSNLYVNDQPDGDYGLWRWQQPAGVLVLTSMTQGIMVEFIRNGATDAELGFTWSPYLEEYNDVLLPKGCGRGYFALILGLRVIKSPEEIKAQSERIRQKSVFRFFRRLIRLGRCKKSKLCSALVELGNGKTKLVVSTHQSVNDTQHAKTAS